MSEGIWFKLQPAILEFGFFIFLAGSYFLKKPLLVVLIQTQQPNVPELIKNHMSAMTIRLSLFMLFHSILATWAAFKWSTESWAYLKGLGLTISLIIYMGIEILWFKRKILREQKKRERE